MKSTLNDLDTSIFDLILGWETTITPFSSSST